MPELLISAAVSIGLAILAFVLGRLNLKANTALERNEELRRRRIDTYADFCASVVEYRRAQLHRWYVGADMGVGSPSDAEQQRPDVAQEVRSRRAAAWADFYRVLMICDDKAVEDLARRALELTRNLKFAPDTEQLGDLSNQVHAAVDSFARGVATSVLEPTQRPLAPAR